MGHSLDWNRALALVSGSCLVTWFPWSYLQPTAPPLTAGRRTCRIPLSGDSLSQKVPERRARQGGMCSVWRRPQGKERASAKCWDCSL